MRTGGESKSSGDMKRVGVLRNLEPRGLLIFWGSGKGTRGAERRQSVFSDSFNTFINFTMSQVPRIIKEIIR